MKRMNLEEVRLHLADVPAEEFGCVHETCAIGQLNLVLTGKKSHSYYGNVYPFDVARAVAALNDNISPESRKALAMMLPLPKTFPKLTPAHALKLIAWVSEQALGYYDGPDREVLERAVDLARRAVSGETYTEEEVTAVSSAADKIILCDMSNKCFQAVNVMIDTAQTLLRVVLDTCWNVSMVEAVCGMARLVCRKKDEWREWLAEYLRIRLEA